MFPARHDVPSPPSSSTRAEGSPPNARTTSAVGASATNTRMAGGRDRPWCARPAAGHGPSAVLAQGASGQVRRGCSTVWSRRLKRPRVRHHDARDLLVVLDVHTSLLVAGMRVVLPLRHVSSSVRRLPREAAGDSTVTADVPSGDAHPAFGGSRVSPAPPRPWRASIGRWRTASMTQSGRWSWLTRP